VQTEIGALGTQGGAQFHGSVGSDPPAIELAYMRQTRGAQAGNCQTCKRQANQSAFSTVGAASVCRASMRETTVRSFGAVTPICADHAQDGREE